MTLLTWSNLDSVRENFGYPADGTVSAILFITGISWQKCLGAHQARMQGLLLQLSWSLAPEGFQFCLLFFSIFMPPQLKTTAENYCFVICDCGKLVKRTSWFLLRFTIVLNDILSQQTLYWQNVSFWRTTIKVLCWTTNNSYLTPRGRGTLENSWWGCFARFSKFWPYFRPKNVIFHTRFQTRRQKIHTRFQTWPLGDCPFRQKLCHHYLD